MKRINDVTLADIMPDSIAKDKQVSAAAKALDGRVPALVEDIEKLAIYANIDTLPSDALDHLAVQFDVAAWRDKWPVTLKRTVLKTAISDKRIKGTVAAVKQALASIGSAAEIVEWWQTNPKGEPHTFTIYATQADFEGLIDDEMQEDLMALLDDAKPLRSHYNFVMQQKAKTGINAFACFRVGVYTKLQ